MNTEEFLFRRRPAEHWLRLRTEGDDEARWEAIDAIRHLCAPDVGVPLFIDTLKHDSYWRARALAAHALFDLACEPDLRPQLASIVPQLATALDDPSLEVREQVFDILGLFGAPADKSNGRDCQVRQDWPGAGRELTDR
jgi:HEAT repeat protein